MSGNQQYIDAVNKLLVNIGAKSAPEVVVIDPSPDAEVKNCFYNVERHVAKMGGTVVYGWAIGVSTFLVEAEKHAVWKTPAGNLRDITPRIPVMPSILFVKDDDFVYTGQYVDNVRLNVTANPVVDDWIEICEGIEVLFSFGKRTDEQEISMPENIVPFLKHLEDLKMKYGHYLAAGGNKDTQCFCGRPLLYRNCHGADMPNLQKGLESARNMFRSSI
ncbi:MAG: hypothetical protein JWR67_3035 [Mucilaginibacter sp.]|nr:hypothetical protein [Mucilaginibacter sp.]